MGAPYVCDSRLKCQVADDAGDTGREAGGREGWHG